MAKASIVITTYNRPELLKRAIRSVLNQEFDDYEIIVVNDGGGYAEENPFISKVSWIDHNKNKGLSAARNTGIKAAKGEYIVCLDDDNELLPNFLKDTIEEIGSYDAITGQRIIQYKDIAEVAMPKLSRFTSVDQAWLIKKSVFDEIMYDEELRANEDADFGIRFFKKFGARVLDKPVCVVYDTENSLSFPDERELKGIELFLKKNLKEYDDPDELRYLYRLVGRKYYRGGHRLKGLHYFWKSFLADKNQKSFLHFIIILLFGWTVYDKFMSYIEKIRATP